MDKNKKVFTVIAVALGAFGLLKLLGKPAEGESARMSMSITDEIGNPVSAGYIGGQTYNATITVKNTSSQGGTGIGYTMNINASAALTGTAQPYPASKTWPGQSFAAGETKTFTYAFALPWNVSASTLTVAANATNPATGAIISTALPKTGDVLPADILPGAEVGIVLPP